MDSRNKYFEFKRAFRVHCHPNSKYLLPLNVWIVVGMLCVTCMVCCWCMIMTCSSFTAGPIPDDVACTLGTSVAAVTQLRTLSMHDLSLPVLKVLPERTWWPQCPPSWCELGEWQCVHYFYVNIAVIGGCALTSEHAWSCVHAHAHLLHLFVACIVWIVVWLLERFHVICHHVHRCDKWCTCAMECIVNIVTHTFMYYIGNPCGHATLVKESCVGSVIFTSMLPPYPGWIQ